MAILALGGMGLSVGPRSPAIECSHDALLTVKTAGVERSICDICGHVGVRFVDRIEGPLSRQNFARPADQPGEPFARNPFSEEPELGVTRRKRLDPTSLLSI